MIALSLTAYLSLSWSIVIKLVERLIAPSADKSHQMNKAMDERWLTVDDICKCLNVSNETVYKWIEQRAMPGHRVGRRWMFKQDEVDEWVRSGGAADKSDKPDTEQ